MAGLALFTVALAGQDAVTLRRTLKEDSTETYSSESKGTQSIDIPGAGNQETTITTKATYVVKVGKTDATKGTTELSITHTVDSIDAEGAGADQAKVIPKPFTQTGTIDSRARLVFDYSKLTILQALAGVDNGQGGLTLELPEAAVKVGDTWDVTVPKGPTTYNEDQKLTAKLTGDKMVGDKSAWVVSLSGKIKMDMDSSKFAEDPDPGTNPMATLKFHLTGGMDLSGECLVDKTTGIVLRSESKSKGDGKIEIPSMGATLDMTLSGTSTITLKS